MRSAIPAEALIRTIAGAAEVAASRPTLVTIGIRPDHPATGYGYIKKGKPSSRAQDLSFFEVETFKEKPDLETAAAYLEDGCFLWNSGMFIWSAATILELAGRFLPDTTALLEPLVQAGKPFPGPEDLHPAFLAIEKISVDYGILERAPHVEMVEAPFAWDDVGAWTAIENHVKKDGDGNAARGLTHLTSTRDTTIFTTEDHLVATLGIEDLVIVHTPDATLVARKENVQEIKEIVQALADKGFEDRI